MWQRNWREEAWSQLERPWDIIIVGGGITGAGLLRLGVGLGLRVLLVEQRDFAWGTSSRSTKLVHGGLRYLAQGQFGVTRESVRERDVLISEAPGLIERLGFLIPHYDRESPSKTSYACGLALYDLLAHRWDHCHHEAHEFLLLAPRIRREGLRGGFHYYDAMTDDARLVLRVIRESVRAGGVALNYAAAGDLVFGDDGRVEGACIRDTVQERAAQVHARLVINATGPWSDRLRAQVGGQPRMRPSRGSHLVFPAWRLPAAQAITLVNPQDGRPVFVLPWEGVTVAGTTDLDHDRPLDEEPHISQPEVTYLLAALRARFPWLELNAHDATASFSGVRPLVGTENTRSSKVSRAHAVWEERGLLTVTGGKLTTFRRMAVDALNRARSALPDLPPIPANWRILDAVSPQVLAEGSMEAGLKRRLIGRYGAEAPSVISSARPGELQTIPGTKTLWAELRWAARSEGVVHLDDLLLRRVRVGLLLPGGGLDLMPRIREIAQSELGWANARWDAEAAAYAELWARAYSVPL